MSKRTIRRSVFETNSSSMHSICIMKDNGVYSPDELREGLYIYNGVLRIYSHNLCFGRHPFQILCTFYDKLRYVIAAYCGSYTRDVVAAQNLHTITEIVKKHIPEFDGFKFDRLGDDVDYGDIDHQSMGILESFIDKKGLSLEDFLIQKKYMIVIDGDEYCDFSKYCKHHIIDTSRIDEVLPEIRF